MTQLLIFRRLITVELV